MLSEAAAYTNNRHQGWGYDFDGRNTTLGTRTYNYDTVGHMTLMTAQQISNGTH